MFSLIARTVFMELFKVFLLSFVSITGMLLLAGVFSEASKNGLSPTQILLVIPLLVPSTMPYTLPATTLFATCVVYGRLAHDNEILAIKSAGINILRVVWPGVVLGALVSLLTICLYYHLIPKTHFLLRTAFLKNVEEFMYSTLRRDGRLAHPKINYEIHVSRVQGRKLIDAQFMRKAASGEHFDVIARAKEAELHLDMAHNQIIVTMHHCWIVDDKDTTSFVLNKDWPIEIDKEFMDPQVSRPSQMTWQQMRRHWDYLKKKRQPLLEDIAKHKAVLALGNAPDHFGPHVRNREFQKRLLDQQIQEIKVEMNKRPALALGCLCFVLVGCPVGIWFNRNDYLSAFITCFLPIILVYYPLLLCGINQGASGRLPPLVSVWIANVLMIAISIGLYRRLLRN